nr:hypothetical protein [Paenibacillus tarimensis]
MTVRLAAVHAAGPLRWQLIRAKDSPLTPPVGNTLKRFTQYR